MADQTKIEWTASMGPDGAVCPGATFNPWHGCVKVSPACLNCYAAAQDNRYHAADPHWGKDKPRLHMSAAYWMQPRKWDRQAREWGIRRKVFCGSMCDIFEELPEGHPDRDYIERCREDLFQMAHDTGHLDWLFSEDVAHQCCARAGYDLSENTVRSVRAHGERFFPMAKHDAGRLLDGQIHDAMPNPLGMANHSPSVNPRNLSSDNHEVTA